MYIYIFLFRIQDNLLGSVASVTEELAMVRLSIAEENTNREEIVRDLETELHQVKGIEGLWALGLEVDGCTDWQYFTGHLITSAALKRGKTDR